MSHIIERALIHIASSCFLTLALYFALRYWVRRNAKALLWLGNGRRTMLIIAALLVCALLPLREPFDVAFGAQVWYKAITDQISWFLGAAVSAYGLYRFGGDK